MIRLAIVAFALALASCNREPEGRFAQAGSEEPPPPSGPLRYGSTIEAARRPGESIATLVEVASPAAGKMRALVAVVPTDAPPDPAALRVEIWTFDQRNAAGVLEPTGERTPGLRLDPSAAIAPALGDFHRELSAPAAEVHRAIGVEGSDPAAALATMTTAATAVRAASTSGADRLSALATVVRGIDEGPLFESDALGRVLDGLASGAWGVAETRALSDRRSEVTTKAGVVLELHKKGDGWVLAAIR